MITLAGLRKSYNNEFTIGPLNLTFGKGKTTVLIGPSGCGKSTLLRLIIALLKPDAGTIQMNGEYITSANMLKLRRQMGYVIQNGGLFPHLTARANITLMARHLRLPVPNMKKRIRELSGLTRFPTSVLTRFPAELSGGQRQRVSLMRALMLDPDILLLDEPLGALDPMIRADLQRDLRTVFRELGKTVVLVTHDLNEAAFLGDEIVLLRAGAIVQTGNINALISHPANDFVRRFVRAQRPSFGEEPA
jgi:osmoprotectant transport system ATP-binding protein